MKGGRRVVVFNTRRKKCRHCQDYAVEGVVGTVSHPLLPANPPPAITGPQKTAQNPQRGRCWERGWKEKSEEKEKIAVAPGTEGVRHANNAACANLVIAHSPILLASTTHLV